MLNFFITYFSAGFILSLGMNSILYAFRKPTLTFIESIATILLWPSVIVSFLNNYYGYEDIED